MARLRLTLDDGSMVFVDKVAAVEFERICPYNGHTFFTSSLTRIHCSESHRVMWTNKVPAHLREESRLLAKRNSDDLPHIPA